MKFLVSLAVIAVIFFVGYKIFTGIFLYNKMMDAIEKSDSHTIQPYFVPGS